ncbi:MAG TPA: bifunctional glutamate N-acetyltransferase/amino-acid acetyltransferase ArgJ [Candidatus Thermoplasmatota archaeon]|nr:bifunctional glutamate N-acetyltransferase/amino-acid acetyltransferase ArgJ [Candidatus Thermoplasmatota archaeon]
MTFRPKTKAIPMPEKTRTAPTPASPSPETPVAPAYPRAATREAAPRYAVRTIPGRHLNHVPGFQAQGVHAEIKKKRRDVAVIVSDRPSKGAAVFTKNAFAAAPVLVSRQHVQNGDIRAIVCNAGNANACTGEQGLADARAMADAAGQALGIEPDQVIVCSTGIIGRPLPLEKVVWGIEAAAQSLGEAKGGEAAEAITTTDSHPKTVFVEINVAGRAFHVAGIAKGAGMIHPNMATMLAFLVTDAPLSATLLQHQLKTAVDATFNMITIDGDQSTNDTVALIANGAAGGTRLREGSAELEAFQAGLVEACKDLAKQIAGDGEGATALLEVVVEGASTLQDARTVARAVAKSNLVKSALHGKDPNWGRVVAAVGACEAHVEAGRVSLWFESETGSVPVLERGEPLAGNLLSEAAHVLKAKEVRVRLDLGLGPHRAEAWGCDLSEEYVTFNSAYTT